MSERTPRAVILLPILRDFLNTWFGPQSANVEAADRINAMYDGDDALTATPAASERHPYTCQWCDGEWPDARLYDLHFSDLTHKNPDHPYRNPATPAASEDVDAAFIESLYDIFASDVVLEAVVNEKVAAYRAAIRAESTPAASGDATPGEQMARDALIVASVTGSSQGVLSRATRQRLDDAIAAIRAESAGTLDVERLNGDEALGNCIHAAVHPTHPWSGCSNPDLAYQWVTRFRAEYARLAEDAE